jgi:hypothetical protein
VPTAAFWLIRAFTLATRPREQRKFRLPASSSTQVLGYSPVWSSTSAPGALFLTDSMPFSADCLRS